MSLDPFEDAPDLPARTVGVKLVVRFDCPACGASLRMRPGSAGRAIDCPECGAGLILSRDAEGVVTARAVGADAGKRRLPWWPGALGAVGVACIAGALWLALGGGGAGQVAPIRVAEDAKLVPVEPAGVPEVRADPVVEEEKEKETPAKPQAGAADEEAPDIVGPVPPPEVVVEPEPTRPPVTAPGPRGDVEIRRVRRRLGAELGSFVMTKPLPLAEAVEDVEDLLRTRIVVVAGRTAPVLVERPGPVTVREVLDEMARQAGAVVVADDAGVRLVAE